MRVRQRDDLYAHEIFEVPPYDGLLVSKAVVDGVDAGSSRYTMGQRQRLYRLGVREFFRLDEVKDKNLETMGDCGAFSYVKEDEPPYSIDEVLDFYESCNFDYGVSIDHIILGYDEGLDQAFPGFAVVPQDWRKRQKTTLELAERFILRHQQRNCDFVPVGVVQGWSPRSFAEAFQILQDLGYKLIALGGLVPLKTYQILAILEGLEEVRDPQIGIHLLGVTRCDAFLRFQQHGVISFDSTSPFRKAFMDEKHNYYTEERTYPAIRVPQVEASPTLRKLVKSGKVDQSEAMRLERKCMDILRGFDSNSASLEETLETLADYEKLVRGPKYSAEDYREVLLDRPWKRCDCAICQSLGIDVVIFRGAERNRRRGFHNLFVFSKQLANGVNLDFHQINSHIGEVRSV